MAKSLKENPQELPIEAPKDSMNEKLDMRQLKLLLQAGWTEKAISEFFGMNRHTFLNWKKKNKKLRNNVARWKTPADERVEHTLYDKALGGMAVREVQRKTNAKGEVTVVETVKEIPPDTTAMIFWLKNRKPDSWKDRVEFGGGDMKVTVVRKEYAKSK